MKKYSASPEKSEMSPQIFAGLSDQDESEAKKENRH